MQLSLHSDCSSQSNRQDVPRVTRPNPFNLHTEVCPILRYELLIQSTHGISHHVCRNKIICIFFFLQERGHLKEMQLEAQLLQKKMEEEKARVHKANPYPYTTDYPVVRENLTTNIFSCSHLFDSSCLTKSLFRCHRNLNQSLVQDQKAFNLRV